MSARFVRVLTLTLTMALGGCAGGGLLSDGFQGASHTVARGDTLYSIAWRYRLNHRDLIGWNGIEPPFTIYPGQQVRLRPPRGSSGSTPLLRLPGDAPAPTSAEQSPRPAAPAPGGPAPARSAAGPEAPTSAAPQAGRPAEGSVPPPGQWLWPTAGAIVGQFDARSRAAAGVDIGGRAGQPIVASAAGTVVYSGSGIPSYGRLLIVKHDEEYLSAYAHNRKLLVAEGERVASGQRIAEMGQDTDARVVLHFEIRRQGKPVDPLRYLTARR